MAFHRNVKKQDKKMKDTEGLTLRNRELLKPLLSLDETRSGFSKTSFFLLEKMALLEDR